MARESTALGLEGTAAVRRGTHTHRTDAMIAAAVQWAERITRKIDNVFSGLRSLRVSKPEVLLVGLVHQYQWLEGSQPSLLEREQRDRFAKRIRELVKEFQPNLIVDETPDMDNADLLAVLPARPIPIDIPEARKRERGFNVERSIHFLCPRVDGIRERYWRRRLYRLIKDTPNSRVLMFIGAKHLEKSYIKPLAFPELLTKARYSVTVVNLYEEDGWDYSWIEHWKHPVTEITGTNESQCCVRSGSYQKNDLRCDRKIYWKERLADRE